MGNEAATLDSEVLLSFSLSLESAPYRHKCAYCIFLVPFYNLLVKASGSFIE